MKLKRLASVIHLNNKITAIDHRLVVVRCVYCTCTKQSGMLCLLFELWQVLSLVPLGPSHVMTLPPLYSQPLNLTSILRPSPSLKPSSTLEFLALELY